MQPLAVKQCGPKISAGASADKARCPAWNRVQRGLAVSVLALVIGCAGPPSAPAPPPPIDQPRASTKPSNRSTPPVWSRETRLPDRAGRGAARKKAPPRPVAPAIRAGITPDGAELLAEVQGPQPDTPGNFTLLKTIGEELRVARQHATYAARRGSKIGWVTEHTHHLRHALDPSTEPDGPGLGFGVDKSINRFGTTLAKIEGEAMGSTRADINAARSIVSNLRGWTNEAHIYIANALAETKDATKMEPWTALVKLRLDAIAEGVDQNRDGEVKAKALEGGLAQLSAILKRLAENKPPVMPKPKAPERAPAVSTKRSQKTQGKTRSPRR